MDVAITGASGLIGSALIRRLEENGHNPVPVTRGEGGGIRWDPASARIDRDGFEGVGAVIHLAGEGIANRRWTGAVKERILESRVNGTRLLVSTLGKLQRPPHVLLSGSAIGFYGECGDQTVTETTPGGAGFLADVCRAWEEHSKPAAAAGIRTVQLRTGMVLSSKGGALAKMLPLFKAGLGGRLGSGRQYWSWIAIDDHVAMLEWLLSTHVDGPVNVTAPEPATNAEFTAALGTALGRPTRLPVPAFAPKLLLGAGLANELLFTSAKVVPEVALTNGFEFEQPTLASALGALLNDD